VPRGEELAAADAMNRGRVRRPGLTLTIGQMMKLVVFGAAASLCLLPMKPLVEEGFVTWPTVLLWEAVAIPLAQAVVAFALVKPGRFRDGLILALLGTALVVALGAALYLFAWGSAIRGGMTPGFLIGVILILGIPLSMVLLYILPGPCPGCSRSVLIPDGTFRPAPRASLRRAYRCGSCRGRFWIQRGVWKAVPAEPMPPVG
jgi:hypothetical protein